jgi:hypothetical protein
MSDTCTCCGSALKPGQEAFIRSEKIVCGRCDLDADSRDHLIFLRNTVAQFAPRAVKPAHTPRYLILRIVAGIQEVVGWIVIVVGVLIVGVGVASAIVAAARTGEPRALLLAFFAFLPALYVMFAGLVLIGMAQLLYCIRDMAQKSLNILNRIP